MPVPSEDPILGMRGRSERIPFLFQIVDREGKDIVPPMFVLINPQALKIDASFNINRYATRGAWVEESYGQNLDQITANATTAAFVTKYGLATTSCSDTGGAIASEAYRSYEAILSVYRHNGEIRFTDGQVIRIGTVRILYDKGVYEGYFTNFDTQEDAEKPFVFTFNFTFKVTRTIVQVTQ